MIPAIWRLIWRGTGLRYVWKFLFGSWLVRRIWGDEDDSEQGDREPTDGR